MATTKAKTKIVTGDLGKILAEKRAAIQALLFKGTGSKVTNVRQIRVLRKEIARALTEANKK